MCWRSCACVSNESVHELQSQCSISCDRVFIDGDVSIVSIVCVLELRRALSDAIVAFVVRLLRLFFAEFLTVLPFLKGGIASLCQMLRCRVSIIVRCSVGCENARDAAFMMQGFVCVGFACEYISQE